MAAAATLLVATEITGNNSSAIVMLTPIALPLVYARLLTEAYSWQQYYIQ